MSIVGVVGPKGADGVGANPFEFIQSSAASQWTVNHNLGYRPSSIRVLSPGGIEMEAEVNEISLNQIIVIFLAPMAGRVVIV
jgi:hypothetical protein